MPNGASIPSWLNINPLAGVPGFLQGFSTGASAGASRRAGEQRAAEFAQEQAFRESQAQEANAIRRQAMELDAAQFQENLRIKQEAAEREARTAADQLEGMQGFERDLPAMGYEKSLTKWAHKLFAARPQEMVDLARTQRSMAEPELRDIGGRQFAFNRATGALLPIQRGTEPRWVPPADGRPGYYLTEEGQIRFPPSTATPKAGEVTEADTLRHRSLREERANLDKWLNDPIALAKKTAKQVKEGTERVATINQELRQIETGGVTAQTATGEPPTVTSKEQFDTLPSGTVFKGADGKTYRKK